MSYSIKIPESQLWKQSKSSETKSKGMDSENSFLFPKQSEKFKGCAQSFIHMHES